MRLKGKVALVTGAGSGIGAGIAAGFAAEGASVCINYRSESDRAGAEKEAQGFATKSIAVQADVSVRAEVEKMVEKVVQEFGRLDVAVNNAGIEIQRPFLEVTDDEW